MLTCKKSIVSLALAFFSIASARGEKEALQWQNRSVETEVGFDEKEFVATYAFTNESDRVVKILRTEASCGCTVPSLEKLAYEPGESGDLVARFDIGSRVGPQRKEIRVYTDSREQPYTLELSVDIPQAVTLKRRALLWSEGDDLSTKECEVVLHEARPQTIVGLVDREGNRLDRFNAQVEEIEPGLKYMVKVTPASTEKPMRVTCYLQTETDGKSTILQSYPIYAWIR